LVVSFFFFGAFVPLPANSAAPRSTMATPMAPNCAIIQGSVAVPRISAASCSISPTKPAAAAYVRSAASSELSTEPPSASTACTIAGSATVASEATDEKTSAPCVSNTRTAVTFGSARTTASSSCRSLSGSWAGAQRFRAFVRSTVI
jgi:hypothetical protein